MRVYRWIRIFIVCYELHGWRGVKACAKYLFGVLQLDEQAEKVAKTYLGGSDA